MTGGHGPSSLSLRLITHVHNMQSVDMFDAVGVSVCRGCPTDKFYINQFISYCSSCFKSGSLRLQAACVYLLQVCEALLAAGCPPGSQADAESPLGLAALMRHASVVQLLFDAGAPVSQLQPGVSRSCVQFVSLPQ